MIDIRFSSMAARLRRSEIRELLKLTRTPGTISFGGGLPDPEIFPNEAVEAATIKAIREQGRLALQYSPTEGEPFLREQAAAYMERQGEKADPANILIMASSQQALDLLGRVFIDPGDPVMVERPTYVGAIQAWRALSADFQGLQMDNEGAIPELLEEKVMKLTAEGRKPKFVYLIPDFQNPSGINLTLERRHQILDIASRLDLVILEDSPYRELRYTGKMIPSLYSLDNDGRVVLMKTFSKVFVPGFRIGWVVAPPEILDKLVMTKQGTDLCTSAFVSMIAAYLLQDGAVERQAAVCRDLYARKVNTMLAALDEHMPKVDGLSWTRPEGGMFLWVTLPEYMDSLEILKQAVGRKVAFVIGSSFFYDGSGKNTMRLNYSYPTEIQIRKGIERLAGVIRAHAEAHAAGTGSPVVKEA